ncbi:helix-turn-helix domain-containing protein [Microbacterium sp. GXS0129]|uniref:helix-turn-helix domain-containing protein n=1 Tax=Microbacterium sp. GXS0129 TaxID=3377836 RepID=UPI003839FE33
MTDTTAQDTAPGPKPRDPLWRHLLGGSLRDRRKALGDTLDDVAHRAGVSPQYLSEIERGLKEPSSEVVAAVSAALGASLLDLTLDVARSLSVDAPAPAQLCATRSSYALAA